LIYFDYDFFIFSIEPEFAECKTPNQKNGTCQPLKTCPVLSKIFQDKPVSEANKQLLRDSQCGTGDNGKPLTCCPTEISGSRINIIEVDVACTTPKNVDGECKPLKECDYLRKIVLTKPVSPENVQLLRDSKCSTGDDGKPWVCCALPQTTSSTTTTTTTTTEAPKSSIPGGINVILTFFS
jgi:hypothetical protein